MAASWSEDVTGPYLLRYKSTLMIWHIPWDVFEKRVQIPVTLLHNHINVEVTTIVLQCVEHVMEPVMENIAKHMGKTTENSSIIWLSTN